MSDKSGSGAVLILVLWSLVVLGLLAVAVGGQVSAVLLMAEHIQRRTLGRCLTEAGVARAVSVLLSDTNGWDGLTEVWSNDQSEFRQVVRGGGRFEVRHLVPGQDGRAVETRYGLADEERRVHLNLAPPVLLKALFCRVGGLQEAQALALVSAVQEYRSAKDKVLLTDSTARDYYSGRDQPTAGFESEYEMLLVKDMTPELFATLEPYITIHGSGKINFNTVDPVVVECLVMALNPNAGAVAGSLARKLLAFRARGGEITQPAVADAVRQVERAVTLSAEERNTLTQIMGRFGSIRSTCFRGEVVGSGYGDEREDSRVTFVYDRDRRVVTFWRVH